MQEKILNALKTAPGYLSGEELSHSLKISRQALWKHIHQLKEAGYEINAVPHLGYQLISAPDRLFPFEIRYGLKTKFCGHTISYFDTVSSTMDIANSLALDGAKEGTLVVSENQAKGRGRLGRSWQSPKYKGIYFSLILRPQLPLQEVAILTLLTAVGVCEAIREETAIEAQIKWPNDILFESKKIGGILTELNAESDRVRFVSLGVGLNVNSDRLVNQAGGVSLKELTGSALDRAQLLKKVLEKIESYYLVFKKDGKQQIFKMWRQYAVTLGKRVKIASREAKIEGVALDLDSDGALLIRTDSGTITRVISGDVIH